MANQRLGISATATAPAGGRFREMAPTSSWAKARERMAWLFVAPAILVVIIVAIYPLLRTFQLSFTNARLGSTTETRWVGFANYERLWRDDQFWESIKNTVVFTVASVGFETLLGMIVALTIHSNFKGRGLIRTSMLVPWAIPTAIWGLPVRTQAAARGEVSGDGSDRARSLLDELGADRADASPEPVGAGR